MTQGRQPHPSTGAAQAGTSGEIPAPETPVEVTIPLVLAELPEVIGAMPAAANVASPQWRPSSAA